MARLSCAVGRSCVTYNPSAGQTKAAFSSASLDACKDFIRHNVSYTHFADFTGATTGARCHSCAVPLQSAAATDNDTRLCHYTTALSAGAIAGIVVGIVLAVFALAAVAWYFLVRRPAVAATRGAVGGSFRVRRAGFAAVPTEPEGMPMLNLPIRRLP